jgi:membrane protein DedA with SNARE-associated domain
MHDWIIRLIEHGGYWSVALLMVLENLIPPIPSELILGLAGIAVSRGVMDFWPVLTAGTIGSTLGNYAWFVLGQRVGYRRLRPFIDRWGRWLTVEWSEVERGSGFLRRHGKWAVFFLRFSPVLRTMISLPAGLVHMSHWRFLAFTLAGTAVWNTLLIMGGEWLGDAFSEAERWLTWGVVGLTVLTVAWYVWRVFSMKPRG